MPFGSGPCADGVQGILAYDNIDLISNGFIPQESVDRKGNPIRLLPSSRLSVELQYSVRSDQTGTNLNNLSPGGNTGLLFGSLGGGAGFGIGAALGCELLGDIEPTISRFVFHVCDSQTRLNRTIIVTEDMLTEARIKDNDGVATYEFDNEYPIAILGITRTAISLSDDEIANIGSSGGPTRGHRVSSSGQIQATFANFDYTGENNLFIEIFRDDRKFLYRADNNSPGDPNSGANCFLNGSADDLVDQKVKFRLLPARGQQGPPLSELKAGDHLFITYVGTNNRILRHAIFSSSFYFLFPDFEVQRIGIDLVRAWNFHPFKFKAQKNLQLKATVDDFIHDDLVEGRVDLTDTQKEKLRRLETIESQRLCEVVNDTKDERAYIRGFYFADSRGIVAYDQDQNRSTVLIPASSIRDQDWWTTFSSQLVDGGPGFDENGHLNPETDGANRILRGFLFDISDHVNTLCFDNDKFGYQRELADALKNVKAFNPDDPTSGIGFPNLDLIRLNLHRINRYDLTSAKFQPTKMSSIEGGAYFVRDCNVVFTYDQQFCGPGTMQADLFIRTPTFFINMGQHSRIYVERFTPQLPLAPDGGIWVTTRPVGFGSMSVDSHPFDDDAFLSFLKDGVINFQRFRDASSNTHLADTQVDFANSVLNHDNPNIDSFKQEDWTFVGYDKIIGNQPGYSRGIEITTETGQIALAIESTTVYKKASLRFNQNNETGIVSVNGLADKKLQKITLRYVTKDQFLFQPKRYVAFVFPSSRLVIDNVSIGDSGDADGIEREISIDTRYYNGDSLQIVGDILKFMSITSVDVTYITNDDYDRFRVDGAAPSICIDGMGVIYVFYEDSAANAGSYDGEDESGKLSTGGTEISCLVSNDMGHTWFDHKGVIYTIGSEVIRTPYAAVNKLTNSIHLFYVLNDNLMHKTLPTKLFKSQDAFKAWKRPASYTEDTPDDFGLNHFSLAGRQLRSRSSSVVVGNTHGDFLTSQLRIADVRRTAKKQFRIAQSGDFGVFENGFALTDYFVYFDNRGGLRLLYVSDGKLFARTSDADGSSWKNVFDIGVSIHKNAKEQESKVISALGYVLDNHSNHLSLSYIADGMLFLRKFDASMFGAERTDLQRQLNPDSDISRPLFVVGTLVEELSNAIKRGDTNIIFPYDFATMPSFNEKMSVSEIGSKGFVGASGLTRFFYQDGNGEIRGVSMVESKIPVLDATLKARS